MWRYIARRLLLFGPTLLLGSVIIFVIMRVMPGDVTSVILSTEDISLVPTEDVERVRRELGLDDPLIVQYGTWFRQMFDGSFGGNSLVQNRPLKTIVAGRFPATLQLAVYAVLLSILIGIPVGIAAALEQDRWPDYIGRLFTIGGLALPSFWVALLVIMLLVIFFRWTPPVMYFHLWEKPLEHLKLVPWAAAILGWHSSAYVARLTRSSLLEVLRSDYVRTARSKGLSQRIVTVRHALRNALLPVITITGLYLATLLEGTVIIESIFGIPGIGSQLLEGIRTRDYPVVQSIIMLFFLITQVANLVVDVSYSWIDPRLRFS